MADEMTNHFTAYEAYKMAYNEGRRPSNTSIWGAVLGGVGVVAAAGAWIFGGTYANAKSNGNQQLIAAYAAHSQQMETLLANTINSERNERVSTTSQQLPTLNDYITLSQNQSGSQTTTATNSALAQAEATLLTGALTGQVQTCPQKVSLYSAPAPCPCPGSCN